MQSYVAKIDQQLLTDYWQRLDGLTEAEWRDFYVNVRQALLRCPAAELASLPDDKESYIDEFFTEKIFFKAQRTADGIQSISGGALCVFFRRYLKDRIDYYKRFSSDDVYESPETENASHEGEVHSFIREYGETLLAERVAQFLAQLPSWGLLMLGGHFCADAENSKPMSELCKNVPSYHYKAQKLGITVSRRSDSFLGYEHTQIGQWIESLGVKVAPENHALMLFLLGALCLEALALSEESQA